MLSLSSYFRYLETDAKVLFLSLEHFTHFIKSVLLRNILLTNSLLFWELDLMFGTFSK